MCSLASSVTGFVQLPSQQGRLSYLPPTISYVRTCAHCALHNRHSRSGRLRISPVLPDFADYSLSASPGAVDDRASAHPGKLARSREQAKRFLRLSLSQNSPPGPVQLIPWRPDTEVAPDGVRREDMVSAELGTSPSARGERSSSIVGGPLSGMVNRPDLAESVRSASGQQVTPEPQISITSLANEKPVASGNGISVTIGLAEPVLYLQGFDQNDTTSRSTTMLRGSLLLRVTKQAKLKTISLNFKGKSETEWPEGKLHWCPSISAQLTIALRHSASKT